MHWAGSVLLKKALRKGFSECIHSASETVRETIGRWKPKDSLSIKKPMCSDPRQVELAFGALHIIRLVFDRISRSK